MRALLHRKGVMPQPCMAGTRPGHSRHQSVWMRRQHVTAPITGALPANHFTSSLQSQKARSIKLYAAAGEAPVLGEESTTWEEDLVKIQQMMEEMGVELDETGEEPEQPFDYDAALNAAEPMTYIERLNMEYGIPDMIVFTEGHNGLPRVWLKHCDSAMGVEIYLHGATLTQWLRPNGSCALDAHPALELHPDANNKGAGLRFAFPVYREGTSMTLDDGFAGRLPWEVVAAGLTCMPGVDGLQGGGADAALAEFKQRLDAGEFNREDPLEASTPVVVDTGLPQDMLNKLAKEEVVEKEEAAVPAPVAEPKKRGRKKKVVEGAVPEDTTLTPAPAEAASSSASLDSVQDLADSGSDREADELSGLAGGLDDAGLLGDAEGDELEAIKDEILPLRQLFPEVDDMNLSPAAADLLYKLQEGVDPAPYVTLRLVDNEQTRSVWPHNFELLVKYTIMETDDFQSLEVQPGTDGVGAGDTLADIEADDEAAMQKRMKNVKDPVTDSPGRKDPDTGLDVPIQLRVQAMVVNRDPPETADRMEFEIAALMQFATRDILKYGDFVKVLGLGNATAIDYCHDARFGAIMSNEDGDFMSFQGQKMDAVFPRGLDSDVKITPGDGTHYEILPRGGFTDVTLFHEGVNPSLAVDPTRNLAGVGVGKVLAPKRLAPGEYWEGEFVVRWHNHYWDEPLFGEDLPYIPPLDNKEFGGSDETAGIFADLEDEFGGDDGDDEA